MPSNYNIVLCIARTMIQWHDDSMTQFFE